MRKSIKDNDRLGRAIFSSGQAKQATRGNIQHHVFLERENKPLSVDRLGLGFCSEKKLTDIQDKNAELRSTTHVKRSFYGWAKIKARLARKNGRTVKSIQIKNNPYHAEIQLPEGIERDEQISHAKELASNSIWAPRFNQVI